MEVLEQFKHAESFAQMALGDKLIATMYVIILGHGHNVCGIGSYLGINSIDV
jgi:hypothetical protein